LPAIQSQQFQKFLLPVNRFGIFHGRLVYEDPAGKVWLSYNDPRWLAQRHGLGIAVAQIVNSMADALEAAATKATKRP
jgi:hypothetical protein